MMCLAFSSHAGTAAHGVAWASDHKSAEKRNTMCDSETLPENWQKLVLFSNNVCIAALVEAARLFTMLTYFRRKLLACFQA